MFVASILTSMNDYIWQFIIINQATWQESRMTRSRTQCWLRWEPWTTPPSRESSCHAATLPGPPTVSCHSYYFNSRSIDFIRIISIVLHYLDINQFSYRLLQLKNYSSCLTVFIRIMIHYVLSPVSYIVCVRTTAITGVITNWLI